MNGFGGRQFQNRGRSGSSRGQGGRNNDFEAAGNRPSTGGQSYDPFAGSAATSIGRSHQFSRGGGSQQNSWNRGGGRAASRNVFHGGSGGHAYEGSSMHSTNDHSSSFSGNGGGRQISSAGGQRQEPRQSSNSSFNPFGATSTSPADYVQMGSRDTGNRGRGFNNSNHNGGNRSTGGDRFGGDNSIDFTMGGGRRGGGSSATTVKPVYSPFVAGDDASTVSSLTATSDRGRNRNYNKHHPGGAPGFPNRAQPSHRDGSYLAQHERQHHGWQGSDDACEMDYDSGANAFHGGIFAVGSQSNQQQSKNRKQVYGSQGNVGGSSGFNPFEASSAPTSFQHSNTGSTGGYSQSLQNKFTTDSNNYETSSGSSHNLRGNIRSGNNQIPGEMFFGMNQNQAITVSTLKHISADDLGLDFVVNEDENDNFSAPHDEEVFLSDRRDRHALDAEPLKGSSLGTYKVDDKLNAVGIDVTFADSDDPFSNISELAPLNCRPSFAELDRFNLVPEHAPI